MLAAPPLFTLTPAEVIGLFGAAFDPADHHFTGPVTAQQCEGHGSVFHEEGRVLACLARKRGGPVLEIGSDMGVSTRYILEGLGPHDWIDAVDTYHKWDPAIYSDQIRTHTCRSDEFQSWSHYRWAFVDGDHRFPTVQSDTDLCLRHEVPLIVYHDAGPNHPPAVHAQQGSDVRRAVLDYPWPSGWSLFDVQTKLGLMIAALR